MHPQLIACPDAPWNNKVWLVDRGRRRWVPSVDHLASYGLSLSQVVQATSAEIRRHGVGGPVPMRWLDSAWSEPPLANAESLREIACSRLQGCGIEFGPGTSPLPTPLDCTVKFADFLPENDIRARKCEAAGDDFAQLDYVMGLENPNLVPDASLDFVVAAHVIEHLRNPLRAFAAVHRKLKPGGQFVLVVPNKPGTFDCNRELTTLEHLILDYEHPDVERDKDHYREFFKLVYNISEDLEDRVEIAIATNADAHFHTWT